MAKNLLTYYVCRYASRKKYVQDGADRNDQNTDIQDLWNVIPLTLVILVIKYVFVKYCFVPLGKWLNISDVKRKPAHNVVLEAAYKKSGQCKDLTSLAKQSDMTKRQVERWWRLHRSQDQPTQLDKFTGNLWLGTFYLYNFIFGLYVLWDKEWLWDMDQIVSGFELGMTDDIWWYYMISYAFYWSLTITQFWDVRRKDFWQMFVHHIATITLFFFTWLAKLYRIGTVVLLIHDSADIVLELGKALNCARLVRPTLIFAAFTVSWILTRLVIFPYCILTRTTVNSLVCNDPLIYMLNSILWILLMLHIMWTWMILQIAYKIATTGKKAVDIRSSSSESHDELTKK